MNLNLENATTVQDIQEELVTGSNSAGGSFLDTLVLSITSGFHFSFYDQDGSGIEVLEKLSQVKFDYQGDSYEFQPHTLHWVKGT